jgi:hypothetical protein
MGGPFPHGAESAPDPRPELEAAIAAGVRESASAVATTQADAARFMREFGALVLDGHAPVGAPGRQGDPDLSRDEADYG